MTFKTTRLRDAITFALAVGATAVAGTGIAFAQTAAAPPEATTLDRIEVTGTRIRQVDLVTAQPVLTISRQDIEKQGFSSVADILQNITATGTPPISRASPLSAGENAGGTFISLRNLGAARTLVLLNGRRLGISTSGLSDISTIPAVAVERVEVLKDGASSIYGSDAVAGVINVITRSNYEGAAASAYYGQYGEGDGGITKGDFVIGFTGDRGSLTAAAEWGKEDVVKASDREYSAFPRSHLHPTDNWTLLGQQGGFAPSFSQRALFPNVVFNPPRAGVPDPTTRVVLSEGGDPRNPAHYRAQDTNQGFCAANSLVSPGPGICTNGSIADKSNTNQQTDLRTPLERKSLYVDGIFNITDDVRFRTNLLFSNRVSDRTVAGFPMQATSPSRDGPATLAANSYFNPAGVPIANWWRRTWEIPRVSNSELTTYRFMGALEGSFEWADRYFDWDVSYLNNSNKLVQSTYGNLNITNVRAAVGPSFLNALGQVQCGTALAPILLTSCVPFNPFLPFGREGQGGLTNNKPLQDLLFQEEHSTGETETTVMSANLSGTIIALPAGDLGFAVGVENRKEEGKFVPDAMAVTGNSTNLSAGPTSGRYTVDELYAELQIPLLTEMPFARELSLSLASRYSDYDTFGDTVNSKFGFKWKPIDSVLVRGTWAEGFRAPTISDLYGGGSQTFDFYTDPCDTLFGSSATNTTTRANCVAAMGPVANTYRQLGAGFVAVGSPNAQTPVAFNTGSNPTLQPETAVSKTLGVVWSPEFIEGLNLSLDWWNIRIESTIVADGPTTILNDCFVQGIASRCAPSVAGSLGFTRDPALGFVNSMKYANRNAGYRDVEGFDFDIAYRLATENWGSFTVASNSTYTSSDVFISTNDPRVPISSVSLNGSATTAFRIRSNFNLGWQMGAFSVNWMARFYSAMKEGCTYFTPTTAAGAAAGVQPVLQSHLECNEITFAPSGAFVAGTSTPASNLTRRDRTGSNTFNDVQFRFEAPWNATIAVGANNVFGHDGPVRYTNPSANVSYYGGFDIGRFLYMKYTQRF